MRRRDEEFEQVAMPHMRSLLRFALRLTRDPEAAEDLVQETFLLAWRGFRHFESGSNARAWLFRILFNVWNGHRRKARTHLVLTPEVCAAVDSNCEFLEVTQALDRLAADHRTVLLLAAVEGFTCREIAEILTVPIGTVMSRLSRARSSMRESLSPRLGRREKALR